MVLSAGIILVVGGLCACAPLFKRISQGLGRALSVLGFLVGILVLIVSVDYALGLGFLSSAISEAVAGASTSSPYLKYFLPAMILLGIRSEEHTSELQSPYDLVCRLLLEKKKKKKKTRFIPVYA